MLEYVANLCATLHVDNDFSFGAWGGCVTPYLASFLPAEEAASASEMFRSRSEKTAEADRMARMGLEVEGL